MSDATSASAGTRRTTKWSDDSFLDTIRGHTDSLADECVRKLNTNGVTTGEVSKIFAAMKANGHPLPPEVQSDPKFSPLREFLRQTSTVPPNTDLERIDRGQTAFMTHLIPSVLALLLKSIPEGYASPPLTKVLNISGQLRDNPYHRLMGTLRFLIDVSSPHSFECPSDTDASHDHEPGTVRRGIVTLQQVRLLHAGVRVNIAPKWADYPDYKKQMRAEPISLEDVLGTLIGFSLLVVRGLQILRVRMGSEGTGPYSDDEEAYYYVWRTFGQMFGIHPPGEPHSLEYLPKNLTEAKEFYDSYRRRHYVGARDFTRGWRDVSEGKNPDGVALADAHVRMVGVVIQHIFPRFLRPLVPGPAVRLVPRIYMRQLIGDTGCARIGVRPVTLFVLLKKLLFEFPHVWARFWGRVDSDVHVGISRWFLEYLIRYGYEKGVKFTIPSSVEDLKNLVETGWRN